MKQKILIGMLCLIAALAISAAVYAWFFKGAGVPVGQYTEAKEEKAANKLPTQEVVIRHVHIYEKEKAAKALNLPKDVVEDPNKQVLDGTAVEIESSERPQSAVTVIDTESGEAKTLVKEKPYPLVEFQDKKEIGVRYGITTDGTAADIFGRWSFLRIKGVNVSVYGEFTAQTMGLNTKAKAALEMSYRW